MRVEVSCPSANSGSHTSQFGSGGLILYWSRIRKFVTYRIRKKCNIQRTDRQRREKAITEATLLPYQWNSGWSGPISTPDPNVILDSIGIGKIVQHFWIGSGKYSLL